MTKDSILVLHNRTAGDIVRSIVQPTIDMGGDTKDVMVLLESVVTGVLLTVVRLGGDQRVLDTLVERVKTRLAEYRLAEIKPEGSA